MDQIRIKTTHLGAPTALETLRHTQAEGVILLDGGLLIECRAYERTSSTVNQTKSLVSIDH